MKLARTEAQLGIAGGLLGLTAVLTLVWREQWLATLLAALLCACFCAAFFAYYKVKSRLLDLQTGLDRVKSTIGHTEAADTLSTLTLLEREYSTLKQRHEGFAASAADGLWEWAAGGKVFYSARWQSILGLSPQDLVGNSSHWLSRIHPQDRARVETAIKRAQDSAEPFEAEYRLRHQDGNYRQVLSQARWQNGSDGGRLIGSLTDLSQRSLYDPLTGLAGRKLLNEQLEHAVARASREPERRTALLYMDLNNFKMINDSLGHRAGDALLTQVAERLSLCVRSGDTVARLGGDEFIVLLEGLESEAHLMQIVSRIGRYTSSSFEVEGYQVASSVSIGVVPDLSEQGSAGEVLRNADIAMYSAKRASQAYAFFAPDMHERIAEHQRLEMDLRKGLERGELFLVYQPIVSLASGKPEGFEALIRWQHPERGVLNPDLFIPLAEESGLILALGEWVLREACFQMQGWQEGHPYVTVNLSSRQLAQDNLTERVARSLRESGLNPARLKLEVTESAVIEDPDRAADVLHQLKRLGVQICMDDFGTGYSSLNYIYRLPIDVLKIDKSFIDKMPYDARSHTIVRTMTQLAQQLGMDVIPEGIESVEQKELLEELDCALGQGYLFAKPQLLEALGQTLPPRALAAS